MCRAQNADTHALKQHRLSQIFSLSAPVLCWLSHRTCISSLKAKNERKTLIHTQLIISRYNQYFFAIFRPILINWPLTYLLQSDLCWDLFLSQLNVSGVSGTTGRSSVSNSARAQRYFQFKLRQLILRLCSMQRKLYCIIYANVYFNQECLSTISWGKVFRWTSENLKQTKGAILLFTPWHWELFLTGAINCKSSSSYSTLHH